VLTAVLLLPACTGSTRHQATSPGATTEPGMTTTAPAVTTSSVDGHFAPASGIQVPAGYRAEIYATGLDRPTALAFGPQQRLYATQEGGTVVAVTPRSRQPRVVAAGFSTPLGLAFSGRTLYVSSQGRLDRLELVGGRLRDPTPVVTGLPYGLHQQDNVVVLGGRLFFGSGSTCNACTEPDARSAAILSARPDGSDLRIVATGLRNR